MAAATAATPRPAQRLRVSPAEWPIVLGSLANCRQLRLKFRGVDHVGPVCGHGKWPLFEWNTSEVIAPSPEAAPPPEFSSIDESCADRISFNVSQHGEEMAVALDRDRFISALIHVSHSARFFRLVPTLRVDEREPMHESRQFVVDRPDDKVPVVWHHTIAEESRRMPHQRLTKRGLKAHVIGIVHEESASSCRPV